jgi:hypothetical protein
LSDGFYAFVVNDRSGNIKNKNWIMKTDWQIACRSVLVLKLLARVRVQDLWVLIVTKTHLPLQNTAYHYVVFRIRQTNIFFGCLIVLSSFWLITSSNMDFICNKHVIIYGKICLRFMLKEKSSENFLFYNLT